MPSASRPIAPKVKDDRMPLEKELAVFEKKFPEMKASHEGKFVLIHGDEIVDYYDTYEDAIKVGYSKFGLEPFLVKQIQSIEQAQFISRCIEPVATDSVQ